jgi:5'-nucleotidase
MLSTSRNDTFGRRGIDDDVEFLPIQVRSSPKLDAITTLMTTPIIRRATFSLSYLLVAIIAGCAQSGRDSKPDIAPSAPNVAVKVIAFNDFHGNLKTPGLRIPVVDATAPNGLRFETAGGVEQFSAAVQTLKAKNPNHVVVSAGDMVGATPLLSALFKDEPTIEAMNLVGIDFHAVGNHEFDYGVAHLKRLRSGGCALGKNGQPDCMGRIPFAGSNFEFLSANVISDATQSTLFPAYGVKTFEGVRIAFIGMTLRDTPSIVRPGGATGLTFKDEVETVNALVPTLMAKGINTIVVVMHEGAQQSGGINECKDFVGPARDLSERFHPAVSVVVTAHSHRYYICNHAGKLITSAGSNGTLLTEIDLTLERSTGKVVSSTAQNVIVRPDGARDAALTDLVSRYEKLADPLEKRVVARVSAEINGNINLAGESALGNLIADAHLAATASPDRGGAVIAFNNPGSLRAPIIPNADGGVTYGMLFKTQPFQNDLIVMNLTGSQIKNLLEQQMATRFGERIRLMGVSSGFTFTWDAAKPRGERVLADSLKLNGKLIRPDLQYRVAANSFIAGGSEGLTTFRDGTERQVSVLDLEALVEYLTASTTSTPYTPPPLGRITRLN